jgi:hypothetical protein
MSVGMPVVNGNEQAMRPSDGVSSNSSLSHTSEVMPSGSFSPSVIPKPASPSYSTDDVRNLEEMFPTADRRTIIDLLDKHAGNKDLVAEQLLQNTI